MITDLVVSLGFCVHIALHSCEGRCKRAVVIACPEDFDRIRRDLGLVDGEYPIHSVLTTIVPPEGFDPFEMQIEKHTDSAGTCVVSYSN